MKTILVVDDETRITQLARDYLIHAGFEAWLDGRRYTFVATQARPTRRRRDGRRPPVANAAAPVTCLGSSP